MGLVATQESKRKSERDLGKDMQTVFEERSQLVSLVLASAVPERRSLAVQLGLEGEV